MNTVEVPTVAFSMWQPWASLVVLGHKSIETRSWAFPAKYQGVRVAVHAGKRPIDPEEIEEIEDVLSHALPVDPSALPHGCLIGSVVLGRSVKLWGEPDGPLNWKGGYISDGGNNKPITIEELAFGNYDYGRFGWSLIDPLPFENPVPFRGLQGFFSTRYEAAVRGPVTSSLFENGGFTLPRGR